MRAYFRQNKPWSRAEVGLHGTELPACSRCGSDLSAVDLDNQTANPLTAAKPCWKLCCLPLGAVDRARSVNSRHLEGFRRLLCSYSCRSLLLSP